MVLKSSACMVVVQLLLLLHSSSTATASVGKSSGGQLLFGFGRQRFSSSTDSTTTSLTIFGDKLQQERRQGRASIPTASNPFNVGFRNALARYQQGNPSCSEEEDDDIYSSLPPSSSSSTSVHDAMVRIQRDRDKNWQDDGGEDSPGVLSSSTKDAVMIFDRSTRSVVDNDSDGIGCGQQKRLIEQRHPDVIMTMRTTISLPKNAVGGNQQSKQLTHLSKQQKYRQDLDHLAANDKRQHQRQGVNDARGGRGSVSSAPTPSLTFVENMLCGAVSRSIAQTVMHPMNTAKTILQNGRGPDRTTLRKLMQPSQFRRLSCGAGANFVLSIPHGAVNFAVLEFVRGRLNRAVDSMSSIDDRTRDRLGPGLDFLSSALATITCSVVSTPQMMITDNIMAGNFPNLAASAKGLYGNGGIKGLYAGWWPGLVGKIPSYALTWTFFQQLKRTRNMLSDRPAKNYENTIMGGLASAATVCIMIPMDTIKTRLVTQSSGVAVKGTPYKGIIDCGMRIAKEEGVKTFYRGLAPRLISVVPLIAIQFSIYEYMKRSMVKRRPPSVAPRTNIPGWIIESKEEYGPEEILEEAAMESSASGAHASPAPHFHKKVQQKESWLSSLIGK